MRTASCLTVIAIGAILKFAVTAHPSLVNLQIAGVVMMATGAAGLFLPRRGEHGWLRRRTISRKGLRGAVVGRVDETRLPPYVMLYPAASAQENNGKQPGDLTMREAVAETVPDPHADGLMSEQGTVLVDDSPTVASEVVEEYIEE